MVTIASFAGGCIILIFGACLAGIAGVGGGGMYVPILLVLFEQDFKNAAIYSTCLVLGNSCSQLLVNLRKRHPKKETRSLIYWDMVMIFLPPQLAGSTIGLIFADILPSSLLYIIAIIVLSAAIAKCGFECVHRWRIEDRVMKQHLLRQSGLGPNGGDGGNSEDPRAFVFNESTVSELTGSFSARDSQNTRNANSIVELTGMSRDSTGGDELGITAENTLQNGKSNATGNAEVVEEVAAPQIIWPQSIILQLICMWTVFIILNAIELSFPKCSNSFTGLLIATFIPCAIASYTGNRHVQVEQIKNVYDAIITQDINYNITPVWRLSILIVGVGIICSLLGIGGGELIGPVLLSMHVIPSIATATTSVLEFATSLATTIHHLINGHIQYNFGAIFFFIGVGGGGCGRLIAFVFSENLGRGSYLIIVLMMILTLSMIVYFVFLSETTNFKLHSYCNQ